MGWFNLSVPLQLTFVGPRVLAQTRELWIGDVREIQAYWGSAESY